MTKQEQNIFFELLQAALWERDVDLQVFRGDWSWERLLQAYQDHALIGVVASVILDLPDDKKPNELQCFHLLNTVGNLVSTHHRLNQAIVDVCSRFETAGIHSVLLKGQGLSKLYPKDAIRSCGDIDIYVQPEQYVQACHIVDSYCGNPYREIVDNENVLHSEGMVKEDITFEIHRKPSHTAIKDVGYCFNEWAKKQMTSGSCEAVRILDQDILVPPTLFNSIYVFDHMCDHYRQDGIGFRQFIDWMYLLHKLHLQNDCDKNNLQKLLQTFYLLDAWQIFGGILVFQLGLPKEEFPLWNERKARLSQSVILDRVIGSGNLGHVSKDTVKGYYYMKNGLHRKLKALRYYAPIYLYEYRLFPHDAIQYIWKNACQALKKE